LTPVQIVFSEGARYVTSYRVVERPCPEAFSVVWVIPKTAQPDFRPMADALRQCLKWKRSNDLWCVLLDKSAAQFTADDAKIEALLQAPPKDAQCGDIATAIGRALQLGRSRGERHVFVLCRSPEDRAAAQPRANIQIVSQDLICQAYLGLLARYEITYRPVSAFPVPVRLRAQTSEGWTETVLPASRIPLPIHRQTNQRANR
jgi:hypothetical protein